MTEREIFVAAVEIENPTDRHDYLAGACGSDTALRGRVAGLLNALNRAGNFLQTPHAADALLGLRPQEPYDAPGSMIGPYKLLEQIGEGGMGLVFMADQTHPVRRKVALKVLKPGLDTRQVVARFEAERQALALMGHPNIATIHDAGTTAAGRPYFVMELVRGVPITDYCDSHRLPTRDRLALFAQVCRAVQHAHQKGVIHRDLKPSNVLVTRHDAVAVPKVIDFGIAKATGQQLTERTQFTGFAQLVGTPMYMSPEQAEMNGLDVDTRSDVYSLGVLLYELLTGTTPFDAELLRAAGVEGMRRLIVQGEPPRPSRRLSTLAAEARSTVSERRGVDERHLGRQLRGELDWVVMRCLEKDRNRRYESAGALATDIDRYLRDEPVTACPPSTSYRLRTFTRRNRRSLATAGLIAAALVAATAVSVWQAVKARDAQNQAESDRQQAYRDRDRANIAQSQAEVAKHQAIQDAAIAKAVTDFLQQDLLQQVGLGTQGGAGFVPARDLTVKEALDRAARRIGQRFQDQPLVEATIRVTIGNAYHSLKQWTLAIPHLERAVALRVAHLGPDDSDTISAKRALTASCKQAGRFAYAITLQEEILKYREARLGPDDPETLTSVMDLASIYEYAGEYDKALRLLNQVLDKLRATYGPTHVETNGVMFPLAVIYVKTDRFLESVALFERMRQLNASNGNSKDGEAPLFLVFFAVACQGANKFDQAAILLDEALAKCRKKDESGGAMTAQVLGFLARNHLLQQRYTEAEPIAREAIAISEREFPDREHRFYYMSILGAVLWGQNKSTLAEPLLLQGYEGMKRRESVLQEFWKRRMAEAGERVLHFYEATSQPDKAREWREKLSPMK